jgi:transcriptional regulator with PAS, ATPase and Fis domain
METGNLLDLQLNELISRAKLPVKEQLNRITFILCNGSGKILKTWQDDLFLYPEILEAVLRTGNVLEAFDFGKTRNLSSLFDFAGGNFGLPNRPFYLKSGLLLNTGINGFFLGFSGGFLSLNPIDKDNYLGTIIVPSLFPNSYFRDIGSVLYIDPQDNLVGLNDAFFNCFKEKYKAPREMLGKPCGTFMSPTPREIQSAYFNRLKTEPPVQIAPAAINPENREDCRLSPSGSLAKCAAGWKWENPGHDYCDITLLEEADCSTQDILFEVEFEASQGYLPLIMLGGMRSTDTYPDTFGYAVGVDINTSRLFLKKYGFVVALSEEPHPKSTGPCIYTFRKQDKAFFFSINGKEMLRFYDFNFIENSRALLSVTLRPGSGLILRRLGLGLHSRKPQGEKQVELVRLKTQTPLYFSLNQFYNTSLSINFPATGAYILQNVTPLKEDIEKFQGLYAIERKRGAALNAIVDNFREREEIFLGESPAIRIIKEKVDVVAASNATVLIQGKTGTGKEVLAKLIHSKSPYAKGPFIKVDCSTLSPTLVESELFGHDKGAFTGAILETKGKFEQADHGTLFIDEVNNLNLQMQAKILGFLQDQTITRVGGRGPIKLDLRIIIASNIRLEDMIKKGIFREDLYFRINIVNIELPPLKARKEDLAPLCEYFVKMYSLQHNKDIKGLSREAHRKIYQYEWPGNVRELKNIIHRAVIFCNGEWIEADMVETSPSDIKEGMRPRITVSGKQRQHHGEYKPSKRLDKKALLLALKSSAGNVKRAAEMLGMARPAVYYNLKKHAIDPDEYRK